MCILEVLRERVRAENSRVHVRTHHILKSGISKNHTRLFAVPPNHTRPSPTLWRLQKLHKNVVYFRLASDPSGNWARVHALTQPLEALKNMQGCFCNIFRDSLGHIRTTSRGSKGYTGIHHILVWLLGTSPKITWHVTCDTHYHRSTITELESRTIQRHVYIMLAIKHIIYSRMLYIKI